MYIRYNIVIESVLNMLSTCKYSTSAVLASTPEPVLY